MTSLKLLNKKQHSPITVSYWLAAPAIFLFSVFVILPAVFSIFYSLNSWDGIGELKFIGLRNFRDMFHDERFFNALKNTMFLTIALTILENFMALALALLLFRLKYLKSFFRSIFYIPVLLSGIVTGYVWVAILNYTFGVFNQMLLTLGLPVVDWLGNPHWVMWTVIMVMVWKGAGFYMIIYLAGLTGIPKELLEASEIDGANWFAQLIRIILPLLVGTFTINLTLSLIGGLRVFDQIVAMTSGGPGFATETITYQIFSVAFSEGRQGYGTALAIVLFLITLVFTIFQNAALRKFGAKE